MKTPFVRKEDMGHSRPRAWWLVDAEGLTLGRLSTRIATVLRGKHKACYTPHVDTGDFVVVVNAEKIALTGDKTMKKVYYHHTGYPGGLKTAKFEEMQTKKPTFVVQNAVKGMLPKNAMNRHTLHRLKVYAGATHPHNAQQPQPLEI